MFSHLRTHALARSVTVARSSAVQAFAIRFSVTNLGLLSPDWCLLLHTALCIVYHLKLNIQEEISIQVYL